MLSRKPTFAANDEEDLNNDNGLGALYQFKPLLTKSSNRLTTVLPMTRDGLLQCQLRVVDLKESPKPHYTALSYTWASPLHSPSQEEESHNRWIVTIDDTRCCIQRILFDYLDQLRRSSDKRQKDQFWINVLCIDRSDVEERSEQVNMMAQLYRSAGLFVVWLAAKDEDTAQACEGLAVLAEHERQHESSQGRPDSALQIYEIRHYIGAVANLLRRSWFRRAWMLQEFILAQRTVFLRGHSLGRYSGRLQVPDCLCLEHRIS